MCVCGMTHPYAVCDALLWKNTFYKNRFFVGIFNRYTIGHTCAGVWQEREREREKTEEREGERD